MYKIFFHKIVALSSADKIKDELIKEYGSEVGASLLSSLLTKIPKGKIAQAIWEVARLDSGDIKSELPKIINRLAETNKQDFLSMINTCHKLNKK
ncbi:MAG: hypothetical protein KKA19_02050, partial [Candidatus Margulisbacteria bacterium]|nr:hypothetical protein [Candidatus Margulisiibacteriota bacterium]